VGHLKVVVYLAVSLISAAIAWRERAYRRYLNAEPTTEFDSLIPHAKHNKSLAAAGAIACFSSNLCSLSSELIARRS